MNSLKINSIYGNMAFKGIKNINKPVKKVITNAAKSNPIVPAAILSGFVGAGIIYKSINNETNERITLREQAKRYNEKESSDSQEDFINRIIKLNEEVQARQDAGEDITHEDILKHLRTEEMEERRLPDFREIDLNHDFFDELNNVNHNQIELKNFKEEASVIKNKQIKKIAETICKKQQLDQALLIYMRDIDAGLDNITDTKILKYLKAELKRLADIDYDTDNYEKIETGQGDYFFSLGMISNIVDVYNTITGKYSRYKSADLVGEDLYLDMSRPAYFIKNFREYSPKNFKNFVNTLFEESDKKHYLIKDFENSKKTEALELLSNKEEILDYMYEKYYVRKLDDSSVRKLCREISRTYGVRILLSDKTYDIRKSLRVIKKELEAWTKVSGGKAKLPRILDSNSCDISYESSSAYTDIRGNLHYNGAKIYSPKILRHEIMHLNEGSIFAKYSSNPELVKIIRSIIASKKEIVDGREKEVLDYDKCKYREEFLKAGINPEHIEYAYTNKNEFLAVAAEGDLSQYSPEFKEILIKIGMPKYVFNLPLGDVGVETNVNRIKRILKKHPDAKYDELVELIEEEKTHELSPREKLLLAIFGKKFK